MMIIVSRSDSVIQEIADIIEKVEMGFSVTKGEETTTLIVPANTIDDYSLHEVESIPEIVPLEGKKAVLKYDFNTSTAFVEYEEEPIPPEDLLTILQKENDKLKADLEATTAAVDFILMNFTPAV